MKRLICIFLMCCTAAFAGTKENEDAAARRDMEQMLEKLKAVKKERERRENMLPYPDVVLGMPKPRGERQWISDWKQGEKQRIASLLTAAQVEVDVLLVPFQVQASGIDRINRSLMNASLAQALSGSVKLADPFLIARALGEGERQLDRSEVIQLAGDLHAKKIIWTYAGHRFDKTANRYDNRLHLYFQIQERGKDGVFTEEPPPPGKVIDSYEFTDSDPPIAVFRRNLPKIVEALGFKFSLPEQVKPTVPATAVPRSLAGLADPSPSASDDALRLQFLASMLPEGAEILRERLFARSLYIAWLLPSNHPAARALSTRALMGLHMRSWALANLGAPENDEERTIVSALNGNLPELDTLLSNKPLSIQRIIGEIDLTDIRHAYESDNQASRNAREQFVRKLPASWRPYVDRRFDDAEQARLKRFDNLPLLDSLSSEFPAAGPGIMQKLRGKMVTGQTDSAAVDLAVANYLDPMLAGRIPPGCCDISHMRINRRDVQDFLVQSIVANIVYKVRRMAFTQGLYDDVLAYIQSIDALLGSHPNVMEARAHAEDALAQRAAPPLRDKLYAVAMEHQSVAEYWKTGIEPATSDRPNHEQSPYFSRDGNAMPEHLENAMAALSNASFQAGPLLAAFYLARDPAEREKLLSSVQNRFHGQSTVALLHAERLLEQGKRTEAIASLQQSIAQRPAQVDLYSQLGKLLMGDRRYVEAAKVYAQYPGLTGKTVSLLAADNYAFDKGSLFFWLGETDLAKGFYKISAALGTGSEGGMTSAARIACIDGDYRQAIIEQFNAVQRYGRPYRFRDYFSLLHMVGESSAAWDGFHAVVGQLSAPQVWDSALAGIQRDGRDATWILNWVKLPSLNQGGRDTPLARRFLTMAMVTDRIPDKRAIKQVDTMIQDDLPYRSLESRFMEAYSAIKLRDFSSAFRTLTEADRQESLLREGSTYVLPYFAIAAAKTGKASELNALLEKMPKADRAMDYWLARAVLEAFGGLPTAPETFSQAINTRVFIEDRPLGVEYQLADVAEIVFDLTGDSQFKRIALQIARFNQKIQPWEGWSYALEAALTEDVKAKQAALMKATLLDSRSERLKVFQKSELDDALKAAQKTQPFRVDLRQRATGA